MKRYVKPKNLTIIELVIELEIDKSLESVAAQDFLDHPKSSKEKISDFKLSLLNDIIASVDNSIRYYKFPIIKKGPAGNSYSYYIRFIPVTASGEQLAPVEIVFRISSHYSKTAAGSVDSPKVRVVQFVLGNESFEDSFALIDRAAYICEQLYAGNRAVLTEYKE